MHIEFIDGTPKNFPENLIFEGRVDGFPEKFSFKGKNSYSHKADGYYISLNKLGEEFRDDDDGGWRFQEKLFIPHTSIKMVREQIEYQIDEQDVFYLIKKDSEPSKEITYAKIKEKLESNGVEFSEKELRAILETLEDVGKINKPDPNTYALITAKAKNRADSLVLEDKMQEIEEIVLDENYKRELGKGKNSFF